MDLPLDGYRVIDLSQNVAGPFCSQILADLGADVIKVEPLDDGDSTRQWAPPSWESEAVMYLAFNRNKRSVALNLKEPAGRDLLDRLLRTGDVLVHALRPLAAERLRVDSESLARDHPKVLLCAITAFGSTGPMRDEPGYDPILQAFSGMMSVTGERSSPPVRAGTSIIDMGTGLWAALSVVAGLLKRERGQAVSTVEASLLATALAWLPYQIVGHLATGEEPQRWGSELPMLCPYGAYETSDRPIMIAVGNQRLWHLLCEALQMPELGNDPRFVTNAHRVENRDALRTALESRLRDHAAQHWIERLTQGGIPSSIVNSVSDAMAHPQVEAISILDEPDHPTIPDLRLVGLPLLLDGTRPKTRIAPPLFGEHTASVLEEVGLSPEEIENLRSMDVIHLAK